MRVLYLHLIFLWYRGNVPKVMMCLWRGYSKHRPTTADEWTKKTEERLAEMDWVLHRAGKRLPVGPPIGHHMTLQEARDRYPMAYLRKGNSIMNMTHEDVATLDAITFTT